MSKIEAWDSQKSSSLYGVENWGGDYFKVSPEGTICVHPSGNEGPKVDLHDIVCSLSERGVNFPVLIRFNDILRHRVKKIFDAFSDAITSEGYQGKYFPAYPVKVNQQRHVVEVLRKAGKEVSMGLEVGSKPELIAVLAIHDNPNALLICNGYKDREYIELALMSQKVGRRTVIVIEKFSELESVIELAKKHNIEPEIGLRIKLSYRGSGRWESSGGDRAKFGLTISEMLQAVELLERSGFASSVKLLHFHIGSQLTAINAMRKALKEVTQIYVQLREHCPELCFLDVGGGLGVDYDGSKTNFASSMNYTVEEYARDVIWTVKEICQAANAPHPHIVTEAGRATAAHHSVLVFNTLGIANTFRTQSYPEEIRAQTSEPKLLHLADLLEELCPKNCQETLHDTLELRQEISTQFNMGLISLNDRALADDCFRALLNAISQKSTELSYIPEDLAGLPAVLSDTYFCNFSLFQSLPDHWAIDQVFPVCPIHRLNEEPKRPVVLGDITCDSDGIIKSFADLKDVKRYLLAHDLEPGQDYFLAAFLVGAYQEILGDLHNLFGDTNAVHVDVKADQQYEFKHFVAGDTIEDVLRYVQYSKQELCDLWRESVEHAVKRGSLSAIESSMVYKRYANAFEGYTYLLEREE